jgi:hypothetical protein
MADDRYQGVVFNVPVGARLTEGQELNCMKARVRATCLFGVTLELECGRGKGGSRQMREDGRKLPP